jgi:hypothetical protein
MIYTDRRLEVWKLYGEDLAANPCVVLSWEPLFCVEPAWLAIEDSDPEDWLDWALWSLEFPSSETPGFVGVV